MVDCQAGRFADAHQRRRWRSDRISHEHHDAADVGLVAGVDGALGAALVERAQDPAPVALDEESDDGLPAALGVAHRDEAAVGRGLVGIDPDVVAQIAIYRLPAVCEVTGLSKATIYRLLARGEFPERVKLSPRCVGWRVAEVDAWLAARTAVREEAAPG